MASTRFLSAPARRHLVSRERCWNWLRPMRRDRSPSSRTTYPSPTPRAWRANTRRGPTPIEQPRSNVFSSGRPAASRSGRPSCHCKTATPAGSTRSARTAICCGPSPRERGGPPNRSSGRRGRIRGSSSAVRIPTRSSTFGSTRPTTGDRPAYSSCTGRSLASVSSSSASWCWRKTAGVWRNGSNRLTFRSRQLPVRLPTRPRRSSPSTSTLETLTTIAVSSTSPPRTGLSPCRSRTRARRLR